MRRQSAGSQAGERLIESGRLKDVIGVLNEVVPGLRDIRILTEHSDATDRPIVHLVFDAYSIPAALAGDGIHALLQLGLELISMSAGTMLLEEPEAFQHPVAMRQTARVILAAVRRNVQVILTTHSLEFIDVLLAEANDEDVRKAFTLPAGIEPRPIDFRPVIGTAGGVLPRRHREGPPMNEIESIVFCEGYHDRAFWQGWLEYLRCTNLGRPAKQSGRVDVRDPWNEKVGDGEFGFCSAGGQFLRVKPCRGDFRKVKKTVAEGWLNREAETCAARQERTARRVRRLVLSIDSDALASESDAGDPLSLFLCQWLQGFDGDAKVVADGDVSLFGGATTVLLVRWKADDQAEAGLPEKQTLERLVCAAIVAAYPERAEPVQRWLISRPKAPWPAQSISRFRTWPVGTRSSAATPSTRSSGRTSNLSKSCARVLTRARRGGLPKRLVN